LNDYVVCLVVHLFSVPLCLTSFGLSLEHTNSQYFGAPWARKYGDFAAVISSNIIYLVKFLREANELASQSKTLSKSYIGTNPEISSKRYSLDLTRTKSE
jgi:hypothetical protein